MPNDDLDFMDVVELIHPELHDALHMAINFSNPEVAEDRGVGLGWNAGVLFGMHFACQYPRLAAQIERRVFAPHPDLPGPQKAADLVAEGLSTKVFFLADPLPPAAFTRKLEELAAKNEGEPVETDWFPFPPPPHPYSGYSGLSI